MRRQHTSTEGKTNQIASILMNLRRLFVSPAHCLLLLFTQLLRSKNKYVGPLVCIAQFRTLGTYQLASL